MGCLLTLSDPLSQGASSNKNTSKNTTWSTSSCKNTNEFTNSNTNTWQWGVCLPHEHRFARGQVEILASYRSCWPSKATLNLNYSGFFLISINFKCSILNDLANARSYESWFVWRMANKSDEQIWKSVTQQHWNKLWWTGNTPTSKLKNTGPLVIDFILVKVFKTCKYIENIRMTQHFIPKYERQWRAPVKRVESKRYSIHQNIHEENKQKVFFFPLHQIRQKVSKSTLPLR